MALAGADLDYAKEAFSLIDDDEDGQLKGDQCQTAVFAVCAALKGTAPTLQQLAGLPGYNASQMDEAAFLSAVGGIVADDKLTGDNPFTGMDRKKTGRVKVEDLKSVLGTVGDALTEDELAVRRFTDLDNNVLVLFQLCVMRKINVLGITSDRLIKGQHIAAIPIAGGREGVTTVYVGEHNAFSNKKRHPLFSVLTQDKRYV